MNRTTVIQSCKIVYEDFGEGNTLVFLHGFCEDRRIWGQHQLSEIAKNHRILLIDLPGFGESGTSEKVTMEWYADVLNEILIENQIPKASIIGHSMGNYIGIAFAELYPDKIASLVIINSSVFEDSEEKVLSRYKVADFVRRNGSALFVKDLIPGLFWEENRARLKEKISELTKNAENIDYEGIALASIAMGKRKNRINTLHQLKIPVLGVFGKHDAVVPVSKAIEMMAPIENAVTHIQENAGHMSWFEELETPDIVLNFLRSYRL